jgi:hypothetical protein
VCDDYAKDAMRARQEMIDNKCEISGARWSGHIGGHKSWCIENGMILVGATASSWGTNAWKVEKQARDAELAECKQCRSYAKQAVEQSKKARLCYGLKGSLWSTNETRQFDSCMAMDDGSRDAETEQQADARAKALDQCVIGATPLSAARSTSVRSGAGSSRSSNVLSLPASRQRRSGKNSESVSIAKPQSDASCGAAGKPCGRAPLLGPGLLEGDGGFSQPSPAAIGRPGGRSAPSGNSIR